ncbi:MAG TPA: Hsp20/alpha crystallin family protein [Sediminispirochaeta sp.]|nr:Hsp20/alpha crystallin family protein [Sediminispirochaeta sp.]
MNGLIKRKDRGTPARRYDPFEYLQNEINRIFDRDLWGWSEQGGLFDNGFTPAVDVRDNDDNIEVRCDLPGVEKDDLDISISGQSLTIKGEKKDSKEEKNGEYYHRESWSGSFQRSITLPDTVDPDKSSAEMKNGVLTLTLPKKEEKKRKQIEVKVK